MKVIKTKTKTLLADKGASKKLTEDCIISNTTMICINLPID